MSTTLDLIRAIDSGNSRLSQSTFEELVQTRVASAIDARRTEIAQSMFVPVNESKEDLNEKDEGKHNNGKTTGFDVVAKKAAEEYGSEEAGKRVAGTIRKKILAKEDIDAMNEEEFNELVENYEQLDELSKATLARYVKSAHMEGGLATFRQGKALGNAGAYHKRPDKADAKANAELSQKRTNGIYKAVDRLAK